MSNIEPDTQHPNPPALPIEFFSPKSLYTLAGSAGAVWLCCAVISSVVEKDFFTPQQWRLIALTLSELLAFSFLFTRSHRTYQDSILALLNGCLVFVNASGINAVTSGLSFQPQEKTTSIKAALFPFTNEIDWWPSPELLAQKASLQRQSEELRNELRKCEKLRKLRLPEEVVDSSSLAPPKLLQHSNLSASRSAIPQASSIHVKQRMMKRAQRFRLKQQEPTDTVSSFLGHTTTNTRYTWHYTIGTMRFTKISQAVGSGCTYKITLDSVSVTFSREDTGLLKSVVRFQPEERSLSCNFASTTPSPRQKFTLNRGELDGQGRIRANYSGVSDSPEPYRVFIAGRLVSDEFNGRLTIERPPHINQPSFSQNIPIHFKIIAKHSVVHPH